MQIFGHLDKPHAEDVFAPGEWVEISGWGFGENGGAAGVEVRLDNRPVLQGTFNTPRPDVVEAYPQAFPFRESLGYQHFYLLPPGQAPGLHRLEVYLKGENSLWGLAGACPLRVQRRPSRPGIVAAVKRAAGPRPGPALPVNPAEPEAFGRAKKEKLKKIAKILKPGVPHRLTDFGYDFLTPRLRKKYRISETDQISEHEYDAVALPLVQTHASGLILDCGAGRRLRYYPNVVNLEIAPFATTDVRAVNEELPFRSNVFDAVFSLSVLEHVKNPFQCAREIIRVLKPGGTLYCSVPFLQPLHAYPQHYYNMSMEGLKNLFEPLAIERQEVLPPGLPIWTLNWILNSWVQGLPPEVQRDFIDLKVKDLLGNPLDLLRARYVRELSPKKNIELASTTALLAHKKKTHRG